jgi:hypothetical protein
MVEMKTSINTIDSIFSRQDQAEERISKMDHKIEAILHANNHKPKNIHEYSIKVLWGMIKRPNLRIHWWKKMK